MESTLHRLIGRIPSSRLMPLSTWFDAGFGWNESFSSESDHFRLGPLSHLTNENREGALFPFVMVAFLEPNSATGMERNMAAMWFVPILHCPSITTHTHAQTGLIEWFRHSAAAPAFPRGWSACFFPLAHVITTFWCVILSFCFGSNLTPASPPFIETWLPGPVLCFDPIERSDKGTVWTK